MIPVEAVGTEEIVLVKPGEKFPWTVTSSQAMQPWTKPS
jgi:hypothetical protein